jgi:hypothetical protein
MNRRVFTQPGSSATFSAKASSRPIAAAPGSGANSRRWPASQGANWAPSFQCRPVGGGRHTVVRSADFFPTGAEVPPKLPAWLGAVAAACTTRSRSGRAWYPRSWMLRRQFEWSTFIPAIRANRAGAGLIDGCRPLGELTNAPWPSSREEKPMISPLMRRPAPAAGVDFI